MAEANKIRFIKYFEKNKSKFLQILKAQGEFLGFSKPHGYLYLVEIGSHGGKAVQMRVGLSSKGINFLDVFLAA